MKRPVLAIVSDAVYPYNKGGKETRIHELSTRLAKNGWDVHIYTMSWGSMKPVFENVHFHAICPYIPLYSGSRRSIRQGILFGLSCFKLLLEHFDIADVDSMPYFPLYAMKLVCLLKRKPLVATWHEVWSKTYWQKYLGTLRGALAFFVEKTASMLPDHIIAVSKQTAEQIVSQYGRTKQVTVIPNGIDMHAVETAKPSKTTTDIIYAGRLLKHKHIEMLIAAISRLLRIHQVPLTLTIIGEGPELESLKQVSSGVKFFPFQQHIRDLYGMMKSAKVFVLPSQREGFGLAVLEANACGLPVVTVNHPENAARHLVKNGVNGFVVEPSVEGLVSGIQKSLVYKKIKSCKQNCINTSTKYEWEKQVRRVDTLYKSMITPGV